MKKALLIALLLASGLSLRAHDGDDHAVDPNDVFKVSKTGEVNIPGEAHFGSVILNKGAYLMEHRVEGAVHRFVFKRFVKGKKGAPPVFHESVELISRASGTADTIKTSAVHARYEKKIYTIMKVDIGGENVVHTF